MKIFFLDGEGSYIVEEDNEPQKAHYFQYNRIAEQKYVQPFVSLRQKFANADIVRQMGQKLSS